MVFKGDRDIIRETYANYSATIPLTTQAIACGIVAGIFLSVFLDLAIWIFARIFRLRRSRSLSFPT